LSLRTSQRRRDRFGTHGHGHVEFRCRPRVPFLCPIRPRYRRIRLHRGPGARICAAPSAIFEGRRRRHRLRFHRRAGIQPGGLVGPVLANTPNSGLRFETKYPVDPAVRTALWYDLLSLMQADTHQEAPSAGYGVESLYFDTPRFDHYWNKVDGLPRRVKFRIRRYSTSPEVRHFERSEEHTSELQSRE